MGLPDSSVGKESTCKAGDPDGIPGLGRSPGEGIGYPLQYWGFPGGWDDEGSTYNAGDVDSITGLGRSPGEGNGNPLQCSCLENPMDRGAWWAIVHGVAEWDTTECSTACIQQTRPKHTPRWSNIPHKPAQPPASLCWQWTGGSLEPDPVYLEVWKEALGCLLKLRTPAPRIRISVGKHTQVWTTMEVNEGVLLRFTDSASDCIRQWRLTGSTGSQDSAEVMGRGHSASLPLKQ